MNKFIFDVDGTLTPSRGIIDKKFGEFFKKFADTNHVYLVTGSDYNKTVEQCGEDIIMSVKRVYNCSGNDVWEQGKNIYTNECPVLEHFYLWINAIEIGHLIAMQTKPKIPH